MAGMKPLPMPVRIAAGLVATALEQARDLPRLVVEFPVTAVSQALQASMRVQQKVTELAIRGDRALGALRPVADAPSWATFDDEQPEPTTNGAGTVTPLRPTPVAGQPIDETTDAGAIDGAIDEVEVEVEEPPTDTAAATAAARTAAAATGDTAGRDAADDERADEDTAGPNVLPGYRNLTIAQLLGRLRQLSVADLRTLLDWETAHDNRPPFVTMLDNRITTVTEG